MSTTTVRLDAVLKLLQEQAKANARHPHQSSWAHLGGLRHVYYPDSKTNRWFDETGPITKTAARMWLRRKLHSAEGQSS